MISFFDSVTIDDAARLNSYFGEDVVYTQHGGSARTLTLTVSREAPTIVAETNVKSAGLTLFLPRSSDATVGVLSIDIGGDRFNLASRIGGTAADHSIASIVSQDAAGWLLRLR